MGEEVFTASLTVDAENECFKLEVNGVDFDELTPAPETQMLYRCPVINNFVGRIISTEYQMKAGD